MQPDDLIQAYIMIGQKIDVLWNFYVTVHLAIIGLLVFSRHPVVSKLSICSISIAYLCFSFINYRAKAIEYEFFQTIAKDLRATDFGQSGLNDFFDSYSFSDRGIINIAIHVLSVPLLIIVYRYSYRIQLRSNQN